MSGSARIAGVSRIAAIEYRKRSKVFDQLCHDAIEEAIDNLEEKAKQMAEQGNATLMMRLLQAYRKEKYSERYHLVHHFDPDIIQTLKEIEKLAIGRQQSLISILSGLRKELSQGEDATDIRELLIERLFPQANPALTAGNGATIIINETDQETLV